MGVWDKFTSKVTNVGNQAMDKSKGMADQLKTENEIRSLKQNIEENYKTLGRMYYEHYANPASADPDYQSICSVIDQMNVQIAEKQNHITEIKSQITCPSCGKSIPADAKYCPYCNSPVGAEEIEKARLEREAAEQEVARAAAQATQGYQPYPQMQPGNVVSGTRFCTNCGAPLELGAKFCTKCGTPVEDRPDPAPAQSDPVFEEVTAGQSKENDADVSADSMQGEPENGNIAASDAGANRNIQ